MWIYRKVIPGRRITLRNLPIGTHVRFQPWPDGPWGIRLGIIVNANRDWGSYLIRYYTTMNRHMWIPWNRIRIQRLPDEYNK